MSLFAFRELRGSTYSYYRLVSVTTLEATLAYKEEAIYSLLDYSIEERDFYDKN